jgi:hypothetical protein
MVFSAAETGRDRGREDRNPGMAFEYSIEACRRLKSRFLECRLRRPFRSRRYDAGDPLEFEVTPVDAAGEPCRVRMTVEKFVGGGFAGQVYKVRIIGADGTLGETLPAGETFALKVLVPPSGFALFFRNILYLIGFQGAFQPQVNPVAARAGAIWQKFIRRAAAVRLGDESCVNDVHGTFVDSRLGSCGEISDWIEGRTWRLEVDDRVDLLVRWKRGKPVDSSKLGSPEFRAKREFMAAFVQLLNEVGAYEFARQYYWATWKSQPNCLKRSSTEDQPAEGLTAVDFRAGLALLPFLPMSPGDFILILKGLARGSLVQFDRGDTEKLKSFVTGHASEFAGMEPLLDELERTERIYRGSLIDVTHNHVRLLFSRPLWRQILDSAITGWRVRGFVDETHERSLRGKTFRTLLFAVLGLVPILGGVVRKAWGRTDYRSHYKSLLSSPRYLRRAIRGKMAEATIAWHRDGRVTEKKANRVASSLPAFVVHLLASILPVSLHKMLTDFAYLRDRLYHYTVRPVRLYFDAGLREDWLRDMVQEGQRKRIVSGEDAKVILSQVDEPFIQKYLKSLAVHVCTVPVTQIVSVLVAVGFVLTHPEMPRAQSWAIGLGIVALFQVVPISPGSLTRGLYVVYLVIRERNFKDYNIAVFLGFFKYVGYLAFPIQMAHRYPTLARFMAAHWATDAVHVVPVFGESGALLEHKVFGWFYNVPLTLRGRMQRRAEVRSRYRPRRWHLLPVALAGACALWAVEQFLGRSADQPATLREMWWCLLIVPLAGGSLYTLLAGGSAFGKRIAGAALCGFVTGVVFSALSYALAGWSLSPGELAAGTLWRVFILTVIAPIGAILTEVLLPEP